MADQIDIEWPTCDEDGCIGVRLAATPRCLAHARDEQRNLALKQLGETGEIDARGVPITQALLEQILSAAPRDAEDRPTFTAARLERVTFKGDAVFGEAVFQGDARFLGVTIQGRARFEGATFQGRARFEGATFQDTASFVGVTFQGRARFDAATFQDSAQFFRTTFENLTWFEGATFRDLIWFEGARFEQARQLGPLLVYGVLRLDGAHFAQSIQIEVACRGLSCQRTSFPAGVRFRLRGAQIVLDDADLSGPSILAGITALSSARLAKREQRLVQAVRRLAPQAAVELSARPRLLSVQGANIAGLTVSNVDLAECRFAGAHNLDRLRLETEVTFSAAPVRLPWDRRRVIAEERAWRAARSERWATPQMVAGLAS